MLNINFSNYPFTHLVNASETVVLKKIERRVFFVQCACLRNELVIVVGLFGMFVGGYLVVVVNRLRIT